MGLSAEVADITWHPLTISPFRAISAAVISKNVANRAHKLQVRIGTEPRLGFNIHIHHQIIMKRL